MKETARPIHPQEAAKYFVLLRLAVNQPELLAIIGTTPPAELTEDERLRMQDPDVRRRLNALTLFKHALYGEFEPEEGRSYVHL